MMRLLFAVAMLTSLLGCGGKGGTTIEGKVTFTDGTPLHRGVINLSGPGSFRGALGADGSYTLENVLPGDYQVYITGTSTGEELGMEYDDQGNYVPPKDGGKPQNLILDKYADGSKSGLTIKVPSDSYDLQVTPAT